MLTFTGKNGLDLKFAPLLCVSHSVKPSPSAKTFSVLSDGAPGGCTSGNSFDVSPL